MLRPGQSLGQALGGAPSRRRDRSRICARPRPCRIRL